MTPRMPNSKYIPPVSKPLSVQNKAAAHLTPTAQRDTTSALAGGNEEAQSPHVQPPARAMTQHTGTPCRAVWASGGEDNRAAISDSGGLAYGCRQHSPID